jgi:hypothetical protein
VCEKSSNRVSDRPVLWRARVLGSERPPCSIGPLVLAAGQQFSTCIHAQDQGIGLATPGPVLSSPWTPPMGWIAASP